VQCLYTCAFVSNATAHTSHGACTCTVAWIGARLGIRICRVPYFVRCWDLCKLFRHIVPELRLPHKQSGFVCLTACCYALASPGARYRHTCVLHAFTAHVALHAYTCRAYRWWNLGYGCPGRESSLVAILSHAPAHVHSAHVSVFTPNLTPNSGPLTWCSHRATSLIQAPVPMFPDWACTVRTL
jgi:hypothetical protein